MALLYYASHSEQLKRKQQEALSAIADIKVSQISSWLRERRDDAAVLVAHPLIDSAVDRALKRDPGGQADLRKWFQTAVADTDYTDAFLLDAAGHEVLAAHEREARPIAAETASAVAEARRTGQGTLSDLYVDNATGKVYMDLAIPVSRAGAPPVATIILRVDPHKFLYPFVQSWPTPSESAETLIVRRDGDHVVFLNELRHRKSTALRFRLPLNQPGLPAARGALGVEGLIEGLDYRGVPVLGATRRIPGSTWGLVAKMDTREVYQVVRERARWVALTGALLVAGLTLGVLLLFRHQQASFYRQRYEVELVRKTLERRYEHLSRHANDAILLMDSKGRIVDANDRAVLEYGYTREELLQLDVRALRAVETLVGFDAQWEAVAQSGGLVFETMNRRKDGSTFPVEVSARSIEVEGERFHQSIIRDITERRRNVEALREAHDNLRALIETCPLAIMVLDLDQRVKLWSPAAARLFGWREAETVGQPLPIVPEEERESSLQMLERTRRGESVLDFQTHRRTKEGTLRDVSVWTAPLRDATGAVTGYFELCSDITDRKRLDEQIRHTQRLESIGLLAGGIAHDFNNILTSVLGYASLLRDEVTDDTSRAHTEAIIQGAERAADLTMQLLAYAGKGRFLVEPVNLSEMIRDMRRLLEGSISRAVALRLELEEGLPPVEADRSQMQQLVMNLVINGAEAVGDKVGTVRIATQVVEVGETVPVADLSELPAGRYVCLEVSDTGCGMDEGTQRRIFDPFFTTKMMGRGLGLSAVLGIVRGHRGAVKINTLPGSGSTFRVLLPAAGAPAAKPQAPAKPTFHETGTVLVVDDESSVRSVARIALERAGYKVLLAENGQEALNVLEQHDDLKAVLLDMTMPVMSGEATLEAIRTRYGSLPVVLCSGYSELEAARRISASYLSGFLQKPFTPNQVASKIAEAMAAVS